ncbi:SusC/RagA family TonB-linked outer membrane protein [Sphingobacterium sp. DK4209]|uniref:SusC/RagA family TonB-linked outer membrane protein n=2 Tax=Sphingobacterium zhuxiongii TaxID=2662364 RepID=A0A5Q0QD27_9SPHI|nr:SusC/RagA family TonB-linked outer membrane protein [Sphingobacterium sp. DK4209]QGA27406.1 SusC/RagA family TonB-linked outer membrane protein [Sphingobacterium sp. dk4302]
MIFYSIVKDRIRSLGKPFLLAMKLIVILTFLNICTVMGNGLAQQVTLKGEGITLVHAMRSIQHQTGKQFFLNGRKLAELRVNVNVKSMDLPLALESMLKGKPVSWEMQDDIIVIKPSSSNAGKGLVATQNIELSPVAIQERTVQGVISSDAGQPLAGVTVAIKNTAAAISTNERGEYSLSYSVQNPILVVSLMGFSSKEVAVANRTTVNINLSELVDDLDEVVVVGYGKQKKINLTGSVATISGDEIAKTPTNNLSNAIGGRMPGVSSVNSDGRPGNGSTIRVRGLSTLNDNNPLVVVDGVVRSDGFGNIDPNEVENISVLKDASAAAVYGARAANGVILITTKRGKVGKPVLTYSGMVGLQEPTQYPTLMNAYDYGVARNQAFYNQGYDPSNPIQANNFYTDAELERFKQNSTDWYGETFKNTSPQNQHNLSLQGGSESVRYFGSLGYLNQGGLYDNIGFKRYNIRSNIDASITNSLTVGLNLEARQELFESPSWDASDIFHRVINASPTRLAYHPSGRPANTTGSHPVEMIKNSGYKDQEYDIFQGTLFFNQKLDVLTQGLALNGNFSYYKQHSFNKVFAMPYAMFDEDAQGNILNEKMVGGKTSLSEGFDALTNTTYNISLNYARDFNKHSVAAMALYEQYSAKGKNFNARKEDFISNIKDEFFASGPTNQSIDGRGYINDARRSVVGRVNYAFAGKYLFEGTFRYDGSYRFPEAKRFGFFPAVSAGWRISEEPFFKNNESLSFINNLKLRVSKGLIGNDRVNAYQFLESYNIITGAGPVVDGQAVPQVGYGVYPNFNITWEKQDNTNFGLEWGLWNSKLNFEVDYFFRHTRDILWSKDRSVPGTFGRQLPNENYAKVKSKGVEFTIGHQNSISDWSYNFRLVGSYATNEVTQIDDPANAMEFNKQLGRPIGYRAGYEALGLFRSKEEADSWYGGKQFGLQSLAGDIKYADIDGDGTITIQDQKVIADYGNEPRIMYGFNGSVSWRNIDMNFFFQGASQRNIMLTATGRVMYLNGGSSNNFSYFADSWSPENPDAKYPLAWVDSRSINNRDSNFWLRKAGYVRLKSLDLGYNFSGDWLEKIKVNKMRVYVSGYNLFTISQIDELDPEAATGAGHYYPQQRNYNLGVMLSF